MDPEQRPTTGMRPYNLPVGGSPARQVFFVVSETPCPYLGGRWERKLMTELGLDDPANSYSMLSRAGFRRSHSFAFRPACSNCNACVPVRVPVGAFVASRSQARTLRANRDLSALVKPAQATREQYALFRTYIEARHGEGEMSAMNWSDYRAMIEETPIETQIIEYRDELGLLVAAMLADRLDDGASAVYSFFHPDLNKRSLGRFMVLDLIARTRVENKGYVYLGFWIAEAARMAYKRDFQPLEALGPQGWHCLS